MSAGCSGLCGEQLPACSLQAWPEYSRALPVPCVGGLKAALYSGSGAQALQKQIKKETISIVINNDYLNHLLLQAKASSS